MATIFERTLHRTLQVGFTGMTVFSVLFFLYICGGAVITTISSFQFPYRFLTIQSDPLFNLLAALIGFFICLFALSIICLTCLGCQILRYRDEVAIITAFIARIRSQCYAIHYSATT
jgi:hypothetical protein